MLHVLTPSSTRVPARGLIAHRSSSLLAGAFHGCAKCTKVGVHIGNGLGIRYTGAREGIPLSSPIRAETEGWPGQKACLTAQNMDNTEASLKAAWAATGAAGVKEHGMRAESTAFERLAFLKKGTCAISWT